MAGLKLGIDVDDLRLPVKEGIRAAAELDLRSIELATVSGDLAPRNLSESGRRHLRRYVADFALDLSALVADIPGTRLTDPHTIDQRVHRTCEIIDLARDLHVPLVTASAGALTHPESGEPSPLALEALRRIGEAADARGVVYAIRPTYESADRLGRVLDALRCPSVRVGLDPAAMVMTGADPLKAIERLADLLSLFHVRDATAGLAERPGKETPLGEGEIDVIGLMSVLAAGPFRGPYILRRTDSARPMADLRAARDYVRRELAGD
jgi:sugar phosphate isomerase/epimerase